MEGALEIGIWPGPGRVQRWPPTETSSYLTINWSFNNQKKWLSLPGWEFLNGFLSDRWPTHFTGFLVLKSPYPRKPISPGQTRIIGFPTNQHNPGSLEWIQAHSLSHLFLDVPPGLTSHHHHHLHLVLQPHGWRHGTLKPPSPLLHLCYCACWVPSGWAASPICPPQKALIHSLGLGWNASSSGKPSCNPITSKHASLRGVFTPCFSSGSLIVG